MSALDELLDEYGRADTAPLGTLAELRQKLDAYRAEVIAEYRAAFTMADARGIARNHRAAVLREAADAINALPQDYECDPGRGDSADLLRRMADEAAEEQAAPDFFQPGRTYAYEASGFTAPELLTVFRVACTTIHPATGAPFAFGWIRRGESTGWAAYVEPADDWPHAWTEITEGGDAR
jgi:hypothetical protein